MNIHIIVDEYMYVDQWRREGIKAERWYFPKWEKILEIASNLKN
jgi:hypothetical protein